MYCAMSSIPSGGPPGGTHTQELWYSLRGIYAGLESVLSADKCPCDACCARFSTPIFVGFLLVFCSTNFSRRILKFLGEKTHVAFFFAKAPYAIITVNLTKKDEKNANQFPEKQVNSPQIGVFTFFSKILPPGIWQIPREKLKKLPFPGEICQKTDHFPANRRFFAFDFLFFSTFFLLMRPMRISYSIYSWNDFNFNISSLLTVSSLTDTVKWILEFIKRSHALEGSC